MVAKVKTPEPEHLWIRHGLSNVYRLTKMLLISFKIRKKYHGNDNDDMAVP